MTEEKDGPVDVAAQLARLLVALSELVEAKLYEVREELSDLHAEEWKQHCDQYWRWLPRPTSRTNGPWNSDEQIGLTSTAASPK